MVRVFSLVVFPASMAFMSAIEIEVPMKDSRDTMNVQDISSPALTAKWEERLRTLGEKGNNAEFKKAMLDYIREETADILQNVKADLSAYDSG